LVVPIDGVVQRKTIANLLATVCVCNP